MIRDWAERKLVTLALDRLRERSEPDFIINRKDPYLKRWFLIPRNPIFNIYLHNFLRSDQDFALHDHPWLFNISYIWKGRYQEVTFRRDYWFSKAHSDEEQIRVFVAGAWKFRWGKAPHRVLLTQDRESCEVPCWTIFITGPVVREWGFYCAKGWVAFRNIVKYDKGGSDPQEGCP